MITFDLECSMGHLFEGWFNNTQSFEAQLVDKHISCPFCDDTNIRKIMSPVAMKTSSPAIGRQSLETIDYHRLAKEIKDYLNTNFEDMGHNFTKEALKIHYGVSEQKNIRGLATKEEEKLLQDEGVEIFKVPIPKIDDDKMN